MSTGWNGMARARQASRAKYRNAGFSDWDVLHGKLDAAKRHVNKELV